MVIEFTFASHSISKLTGEFGGIVKGDRVLQKPHQEGIVFPQCYMNIVTYIKTAGQRFEFFQGKNIAHIHRKCQLGPGYFRKIFFAIY